jgi:ABC-type transporter Mla subunit MlaD
MSTLIDGVARGLGDRGPQLKAALATLGPFLEAAQDVSGALEERRGDVRRLVRDLSEVSDELGDRDRTLVSMIRRGNATLGELARRDEPIGRTLAQLPGTLATLQSSFAALRATQDELDPALRSLQPVADRLPEGLEGLQRLSDDLGPAATALRGPVHQLRPLTRALSPTVGSLDAAIGALSPQAPRLDVITRTTVPCLDDVQAFFHRTSSLFKFGDAYQVTPRADVVINYQTPALKPIQGPLPGENGPVKRPRKCFNRGGTP